LVILLLARQPKALQPCFHKLTDMGLELSLARKIPRSLQVLQ